MMTGTADLPYEGPDAETTTVVPDTEKLSSQEAVVSNFAGLLGATYLGSSSIPRCGTTPSNESRYSASAQDFANCISDATSDYDIVCILPSLKFIANTGNERTANSCPLPNVSEHHHKPKVPEMAASVLDSTISTAPDNFSKQEQSAAQTLCMLTSWTKSTLINAPSAMVKNISQSFTSLVESRVKAWTLLLLRQSLTNGDVSSRNRLLSMLSSKIVLKGSFTQFKPFALPEHARSGSREADVILPLIFEVVLQVTSQGRTEVIPLRAPGTIVAHFAKPESGGSPGLTKIDVNLDTGALLDSMIEKARLVVFKAVASATSVNVYKSIPPAREISGIPTGDLPAGLSSALNLSSDAAAQSPKLQKARSSALRLNSILQGKATMLTTDTGSAERTLAKTRTGRSVQWEDIHDIPKVDLGSLPSVKRQRAAPSSVRLRSMKSFGRPHADPGNREPKNATFGDFGRGDAVAGGTVWGRDGKLLNHPVPQGGLTSSAMSSLNASTNHSSNQNATFEFTAVSQSALSANQASHLGFPRGISNVRGSSGRGGLSGSSASTLPRTATALESWLVKNISTAGNL